MGYEFFLNFQGYDFNIVVRCPLNRIICVISTRELRLMFDIARHAGIEMKKKGVIDMTIPISTIQEKAKQMQRNLQVEKQSTTTAPPNSTSSSNSSSDATVPSLLAQLHDIKEKKRKLVSVAAAADLKRIHQSSQQVGSCINIVTSFIISVINSFFFMVSSVK